MRRGRGWHQGANHFARQRLVLHTPHALREHLVLYLQTLNTFPLLCQEMGAPASLSQLPVTAPGTAFVAKSQQNRDNSTMHKAVAAGRQTASRQHLAGYNSQKDWLYAGSADALREEVMQSSWYEAFRSDMRSSVVVRAVESSVGRIGAATNAATSWTSSQLAFTGQGLRCGPQTCNAWGMNALDLPCMGGELPACIYWSKPL